MPFDYASLRGYGQALSIVKDVDDARLLKRI
jgi:hypothetical protein